jgi:6-phosphogluconolactonase (cycloisomerase 2 family)
VDAETGALHASGAVTQTNKPVCVVFA